MRKILVVCLIAAAFATIPPTSIQAGTSFINAAYFTSLPAGASTVTFTTAFSSTPNIGWRFMGLKSTVLSPSGYQIVISSQSSTGFVATPSVSNMELANMMGGWVATIGEHLQIFPISLTLSSSTPQVYDVPFDYPTNVQWSTGQFEVAISAALESFSIVAALNKFTASMTIAKWDGSAYGYSGNGQRYILNKTLLFGPNCPFTTQGGTNVVKMWAQGATGTVVRSNLFFHKFQLTGNFRATFGASRGKSLSSGYTSGISVCDPVYDIPRPTTASTTVNFYGFQTFQFPANIRMQLSSYGYFVKAPSINFRSLSGAQITIKFDAFRAFYYTPPGPCPFGCCSSDGYNCLTCDSASSANRVSAPVTLSGATVATCPCATGFYEAKDSTCQQCPSTPDCYTCYLDVCADTDNSVVCVPPPPCPPGCVCSDGSTCSSCDLFAYRVASPVTLSGASAATCPCLPGFYEAADSTCQQCTQSLYCETCALESGSVKCLTCSCAKRREFSSGDCVCKSGYTDPIPAGPYCVRE